MEHKDANGDIVEQFLASPEATRLRAEHAAKVLARRRELAAQLDAISRQRATALPIARQALVDADRRRQGAYTALQREEATTFAASQALLAMSIDLDRRQALVESELRTTASAVIVDMRTRLQQKWDELREERLPDSVLEPVVGIVGWKLSNEPDTRESIVGVTGYKPDPDGMAAMVEERGGRLAAVRRAFAALEALELEAVDEATLSQRLRAIWASVEAV